MRIRQSLFGFLSIRLVAASSCGTTTIASQSDADLLIFACSTVTGDIILATNAAGAISFDGIQMINGNFASDHCTGNCSSLTSLNSTTLFSVSQNISLENLADLGSVSLPGLQTVGGNFYLDSLPSLQTLSIYNLSSVGQFHLASASSLVSMSLNQLTNVTGANPSIEIISVGLSDLQSLNVGTSLSSFILRDSPKVSGLTLSTPNIDYLEISLNQSTIFEQGFEFSTLLGANSVRSIGTLNLSGCDSFTADSSTTYDNMILSQNTFRYLYLNPVKVFNNLSIVDNPLLSQALLPTDMSIQNIEIRGNGVLQSQEIVAGTDSWPWGIKNASSMILDGSFEDIFFHAFNNLTLIEISNDFFMQSTENTFDCTFLNSLRIQGYFQGNYTCQGKTVAAGHVRTTAGSSSSTFSTPLPSLFAWLIFSLAWLAL